MKLIDMQCTKCGATLQVNPGLSKCMCQYCGNEMLIDQEVQKHEVNVQGNVNMTGGFEFGYQQQMGVMKAMMEEQQRQSEFNAKAEKAYKSYRACQIVGIVFFLLTFLPFTLTRVISIFAIVFTLIDTNKLLKQKEILKSRGVKNSDLIGLTIGLFIVLIIDITLILTN